MESSEGRVGFGGNEAGDGWRGDSIYENDFKWWNIILSLAEMWLLFCLKMTVDLIKGLCYLDIFLEIEARVLRFLFFILADLSINERCCVDVGKMIFCRGKNKFNISLQLFTPLCIARRALSFNGFRFDNKRKLYFVFHISSFLSLFPPFYIYSLIKQTRVGNF